MQNSNNQIYEEIQNDEQEGFDSKLQSQNQLNIQSQYQNSQNNQQKLNQYGNPDHLQQTLNKESSRLEKTQNQQSNHEKIINKLLYQSNTVDHDELGKYANLEEGNEDEQNIQISITKAQRKERLLPFYVYYIEGKDEKGKFSVARRFNEFFQMRAAMILQWPGCFVPSIPAKTAFNKNDESTVKKRIRYLNDFVKKLAKLPHLFYGEEFQSLLRSDSPDISQTFLKRPLVSTQSIINKYRVNFSELAGKQINNKTILKINQFFHFIKKNQTHLAHERENTRKLAKSYDKLIGQFNSYDVFPLYEKVCLSEYCENKEASMLYLNDQQIKLQEHPNISKEALKFNPYWILYDLIKQEERDAMAFSEIFQTKSIFQTKLTSIQTKINDHEKDVAELSIGKKTFSTLTVKGTNDQIRYKLEVEIQQLKREKQNILIIIDIITAMIAYIQIERYKNQKQAFYIKTLAKIGSSEINSVQNLAQIWTGIKEASKRRLSFDSEQIKG